MQRPRFKRHWDDRKWQNPINSMTESATSNMFSAFSQVWISIFYLFPPPSPCFTPALCLRFSRPLIATVCFCLCIQYLCGSLQSTSSPLSVSWIFSLFLLFLSIVWQLRAITAYRRHGGSVTQLATWWTLNMLDSILSDCICSPI